MLQLIIDGKYDHLMFYGFFYSLSFEDKKPFIRSVLYSEESRLISRSKIVCSVSSVENGYVAKINDKEFDEVFETKEEAVNAIRCDLQGKIIEKFREKNNGVLCFCNFYTLMDVLETL